MFRCIYLNKTLFLVISIGTWLSEFALFENIGRLCLSDRSPAVYNRGLAVVFAENITGIVQDSPPPPGESSRP